MLTDDFTAQDLEGSVQLDGGTGIFADPVLLSSDSRNRMFCSPSQVTASPMASNLTLIVNVLLEQPLTALRDILESNLKVSLKDHEFYLQDTLKLDPHGSLVAQCTHETGSVQVHVEIKQLDSSQKPRINILDIMISADELTDVDRTSVIHHDPPSSTRAATHGGKANFSVKQSAASFQASPRSRTSNNFSMICEPILLADSDENIGTSGSNTDILLADQNQHVEVHGVAEADASQVDVAEAIGFDEQDETQLAVTSLQLAYASPPTKRMAMQSHAGVRDRFAAHSTTSSSISPLRGCYGVPTSTNARLPVPVTDDLQRSVNQRQCAASYEPPEYETEGGFTDEIAGLRSHQVHDPTVSGSGSAPARKRSRAVRDANATKRCRTRETNSEPQFRIGNVPITSMRMVNGVTYMIVSPESGAQQQTDTLNRQATSPESTDVAVKRTVRRSDPESSRTVVWQMDTGFAKVMQASGIPNDPSLWEANHVREWLAWSASNFQLEDVFSAAAVNAGATEEQHDEYDLLSHVEPTDGSALLHSTPQGLVKLLGIRMDTLTNAQKQSVRTFLTHFEILKTLKIVAARTVCASSQRTNVSSRTTRRNNTVASRTNVPSTSNQIATTSTNTTVCDSSESNRFVKRVGTTEVQSTSCPAPDEAASIIATRSDRASVSNGNSTSTTNAANAANAANRRSRTNGWLTNDVSIIHNVARSFAGGSYMQLWQFLLDLLTDADYADLIRWTSDDGEFEFIAPQRVAELWGAKKQNGRSSQRSVSATGDDSRRDASGMTYAKMARILRYYYQANVLAKVPAKRRTYRFTIDLKEVTGYEPPELKRLVETCRAERKLKVNRPSGSTARRKPDFPNAMHTGRSAKTVAPDPASQLHAMSKGTSSRSVINVQSGLTGQLVETAGRTRVVGLATTSGPRNSVHDGVLRDKVTRVTSVPVPARIVSVSPLTSLTISGSSRGGTLGVNSNASYECYSGSDWQLPPTGEEISRVRTVSSSSTSSLIRQWINPSALGLNFIDSDAQLPCDSSDIDGNDFVA